MRRPRRRQRRWMRRPPRRHVPAHRAVLIWQPYQLILIWQPYQLIRVPRPPPAHLHRPSRVPTCAPWWAAHPSILAPSWAARPSRVPTWPCAEASALFAALGHLLLPHLLPQLIPQRGCYHRPSSAAISGNLEPGRSGRHSVALRNGMTGAMTRAPLEFRGALLRLIWKQRPLPFRCLIWK